MIPFSIAFRIDNKLFNIILKLSISWTVNRRKSQFLRKRIDLFKLILKWYFKVPPPNQLSIANMSIYGCQRFVYNLNINKNFKFYWKSFPSEKDCKKWNYFSMAPWWRSALPAAQPRWARGGRRGRRAKPADDAGFFKGKDDGGCYPSGRKEEWRSRRLCRAQAIGYWWTQLHPWQVLPGWWKDPRQVWKAGGVQPHF